MPAPPILRGPEAAARTPARVVSQRETVKDSPTLQSLLVHDYVTEAAEEGGTGLYKFAGRAAARAEPIRASAAVRSGHTTLPAIRRPFTA